MSPLRVILSEFHYDICYKETRMMMLGGSVKSDDTILDVEYPHCIHID